MCRLPVDQPLLLPGDSACSARRPASCSAAQLLATRLRRIGDRLEETRTATEAGGGSRCGGCGTAARNERDHLKGFLRAAARLAALALVVARRHL